MSITPAQAANAIRNSAGRFFSCVFIKANNERREMRCRFATAQELKTGAHRTTDTRIVVYDDDAKGYRTIPVERLIRISIDGHCEEVA